MIDGRHLVNELSEFSKDTTILKIDAEPRIESIGSETLDFIVLPAGVLAKDYARGIKSYLDECARVLKDGGLLFLQGCPDYLPSLGVYLDGKLTFKYWIAVESAIRWAKHGLPSAHAPILLFVKGKSFDIKRVRFPHRYCSACGKTLKDWGGKSHLMHPDGTVASDVWTHLPPYDNYEGISDEVLDVILSMIDTRGKKGLILAGKRRGDRSRDLAPQKRACNAFIRIDGTNDVITAGTHKKSPCGNTDKGSLLPPHMINVIHCGDALEILKDYPDECVDLAFADPPYNLEKSYGKYEDRMAEERYIDWCNSWLAQYVRLLKPNGTLFVLNLPRWSMHHAEFLNNVMHFQNWIVWDALPEPRGKLLPAHYALLFYTKHPTNFTFNYEEVGQISSRNYCLRPSCVRRRKSTGDDAKEWLTDVWWDIHRIRHKRDRDYHPCQLPKALLERLIRLCTNPGDIVLDALNGVGTTTTVAAALGRKYIGIDIDPNYVEIAGRKLQEIESAGSIERRKIRKARARYTKKELQMELRDLATKLGRLPTPEDVSVHSKYEVEDFLTIFPTWNKALRAAKLEIQQ